jgi:hypothetical protein
LSKNRLPGAGIVAISIVVGLAAAAVRATSLSVTMIWPFDHNGLFHLVETVALITMAWGLGAGMAAPASPAKLR